MLIKINHKLTISSSSCFPKYFITATEKQTNTEIGTKNTVYFCDESVHIIIIFLCGGGGGEEGPWKEFGLEMVAILVLRVE